MKLKEVLLPLLALAGFACASGTYDARPAVTETDAAQALPEVRYYVIADT